METWRIIIGSICAVTTVLLGIYVSFTLRQKGPIFSNSFMSLNKEERKKIDKKTEYKLVSIIFGGLCIFDLCETLYIFTAIGMFNGLGLLALLFDMVYAIFDSVKSRK